MLFLLVLAFVICDDNVKLEVFFMSKCPDCADFTESLLGNIMDKVGSIIDFTPQYVIEYNKESPHHFHSLHGDTETMGDLYEECAFNKYGQEKFIPLLGCLDKEYYNIPNNFEDCAQKQSMDWDEIHDCGNSNEGFMYLWASANRTKDLGVRYAPTIYMNNELVCIPGVQCKIRHYSRLDDWVKYICDLYSGSSKPPACS